MLARLDHIALRVAAGQRDLVADFLCKAFGYRIQGEPFKIYFDDAKTDYALSVALEPPTNHLGSKMEVAEAPRIKREWFDRWHSVQNMNKCVEYHRPPEFFISEAVVPSFSWWPWRKGNVVYEWVKVRGGIGGVHHLAYEVDDVAATMKEWTEKGYAQFSTEKPLECPGLVQVFSKPNPSGIVFELITRKGAVGFCADNVRALMLASKGD